VFKPVCGRMWRARRKIMENEVSRLE
jgi:hypothetical protein